MSDDDLWISKRIGNTIYYADKNGHCYECWEDRANILRKEFNDAQEHEAVKWEAEMHAEALRNRMWGGI